MSTKVEISKRLILINSGSGVIAKVLNITVLFWMQRYLLSRISPEEYSLYPLLASLIVFLPLVTSVLTGGLARYAVEAYANNKPETLTEITTTMFALLVAVATVLLLLGAIFSWYIGDILVIAPEWISDARIMMMLLILSSVTTVALTPFQVGIYIRQKFLLRNIVDLCVQLLRLAILFALLFGVGTRVLWVVLSTVVANFVGLMVLIHISRKLVPSLKIRRSSFNRSISRKIISFGGWIFFATLSERIRLGANPILLNIFATPLDVVCYYVGTIPHRQIDSFSATVKSTFTPVLTAMHTTGKKNLLSITYLRAARIALWMALGMAVPLMIFSSGFIVLWIGEKYRTAALVMTLTLGAIPFYFSNVLSLNVAIAVEKVRLFSILTFVTQIINLLLTLYLVAIKNMGAVGAALSTFITMGFVYPLLNIPLGLHLANVKMSRWLRETVLPGISPAMGAAVVWLIMKYLLEPSTWISLLVCVTVGLLFYLVILIRFSMQPQDKKDFRYILNKVAQNKIISKFNGKTRTDDSL